MSDSSSDFESAYYNCKMGRLTFTELWRFSNSNPLLFVVALGCKALNITSEISKVPPELKIMYSREAFGEDFESVRGMDAQIVARGFEHQFSYTIEQMNPASFGFGCVYLGRDPRVIMQIIFTRAAMASPIKSCSCVSKLSGNRLLGTVNTKRYLNGNPLDYTENRVGAEPDEIHERHCERLQRYQNEVECVPREQLIGFIEGLNTRSARHMIERGLFVPATEEDVLRARAKFSSGTALA